MAINIMLASKDEVEPTSEETAQEFNKMLNKYRRGVLKDIENYFKLNIMIKDEAKATLRKKQAELRQAEVVLEMHENGVREIKEDIEKLKAIINKKDNWQDNLTKGDYVISSGLDGLALWLGFERVKVEHTFKEKEHAQLLVDKMTLMQEMHAFAHVKNEGWLPDWEDEIDDKFGIAFSGKGEMRVDWRELCNDFIFGIAVKSEEIAEEMLVEFGERIESVYNKQY